MWMPRGVLPNKEVGGGLDLTSSLEAKFCCKVLPSSPNKRKNLGSSVITRRKSWEKVPILGSYLKFRGQNLGCFSLTFLEAKFGAPTRISEANFGAKPPPPRPPDLEVPPGGGCISIDQEQTKETTSSYENQRTS